MARYSKTRIRVLLASVDGAPTSDAKGDALEELGKYLLGKVVGVEFLRRNILDAPRAHELDLAFWNDQRASLLHFLDAVLIVECKASAAPVGSNEVAWFVHKLESSRREPRDPDRPQRHYRPGGHIRAQRGAAGALIGDKIKILAVLFTREEILGLTTTRQLADLLKEKEMQLTLDRVVPHR